MSNQSESFIPGRSNTVLLLSNADPGLGNVVLAATYSLLTEHPDLEVHYGTFPALKQPLEEIKKYSQINAEKAGTLETHYFDGPDHRECLYNRLGSMEGLLHRPGVAGLSRICNMVHDFAIIWSQEDYLAAYKQVSALIEKIDPAVVVLEPLFGPAHDAIYNSKRRIVFLSPNALQDSISKNQPYLSIFWKYPMQGTGYPYPVPLHLIPANIWYILKLGYTVATEPKVAKINKFLKEHGIEKSTINIDNLAEHNALWIAASSLDTSYPMTVIPKNVLPCGPMYLSLSPVSERDPDLYKWLQRGPTVYINLGSHTKYTLAGATAVVKALKQIVYTHPNHQVLWKFKKRDDYSDDFLHDVAAELADDRLRMTSWITADPTTILETGHVTLFVHHGGANSFNEAVATGVPHLILPMWMDLYDFSMRAEYLGIGVRGNPISAPEWTAEELIVAFNRVLGDGEEARAIRAKAKELGDVHSKLSGRSRGAKAIADIARSGDIVRI